jgi:hypothetical protein
LTRTRFDEVLAATPVQGLHEVLLGHAWSHEPAEYFRAGGFGRVPRISGQFLPLLSASWSGVEDRLNAPFTSRLSVYAVPAARRAELLRLVTDEALPAALRWLSGLEKGADTARTERRRLAIFLVGERLEQTEG